jgi:hypothetical protein
VDHPLSYRRFTTVLAIALASASMTSAYGDPINPDIPGFPVATHAQSL